MEPAAWPKLNGSIRRRQRSASEPAPRCRASSANQRLRHVYGLLPSSGRRSPGAQEASLRQTAAR